MAETEKKTELQLLREQLEESGAIVMDAVDNLTTECFQLRREQLSKREEMTLRITVALLRGLLIVDCQGVSPTTAKQRLSVVHEAVRWANTIIAVTQSVGDGGTFPPG
jgi:hypothetical protein